MFTTGGIGPTHDDITADAIAKAFGVEIGEDPRALAIMGERYKPDEFTPARRRMARIPAGASLIDNPVSKAPGFRLGQRHRHGGRAQRHAGDARRRDPRRDDRGRRC